MFCPKCGTNAPEGSKFCETCGNNMQQTEPTEILEQPEAQQEQAAAAPQPVAQPQAPVYQPKPQPPVYKPQPQAPVYQPQPQAPAYQAQPQASGYQQRPQPAPAYQNNTYNGQDPREKPYTVGGWLLTYLILMIPIVGWIMPFVWAFGSKANKSKKNFFIASLIMVAIWIIIGIALSATISTVINEMLEQMGGMGDFGGGLYFPE